MKKFNFTKEDYIRYSLIVFICVFYLLIQIFSNQISILLFKTSRIENEIIKSEFEIDFIDVGQGDSILIRLPDEKLILVDTGPEKSSEELVKYLKKRMKKFDINKISYLILTHPDSDHVGGSLRVLKNIKIDKILRPKILINSETSKYGNLGYGYTTSKHYVETIKYASKKFDMEFFDTNTKIKSKQYKIDFLTPNKDVYFSNNKNDLNDINTNEYSPMIMIEYGGKKILLTGDATDKTEKELLNLYEKEMLDVDILKVSHHGSNTSTSEEFLKIIKPEYAIISVGKNSYGHPSYELLKRLEENNVKNILSTKKYETIKIGIDDNILLSLESKIEMLDLPFIFCICLILIAILCKKQINSKKNI